MRLCPRCGAKTRIAGTLSGDVAKELCDECGYFRGLLAPGWAMGKRVEEARTPSPFTVIDGGGGGRSNRLDGLLSWGAPGAERMRLRCSRA